MRDPVCDHERFWAKVDFDGPLLSPYMGRCWLWTGATWEGYGRFGVAGRRLKAHRYAYEILHGPIPTGLVTDHLCRVRACVNPAHVEPVSSRENTLRGNGLAARHAKRTHCPQGHAYDEENTRYEQNGRYCRACHREQDRVRRRQARETGRWS